MTTTTSPASEDPQIVTLAALLNERVPDGEWLADELLIGGGVSLLVGRPKVGKSTLVHQLIVSVAGGRGDFLGRELQQGPVLHIGLEEIRFQLAKRLRQLDVTGDEPINFLFELPHDPLGWLRTAITSQRPALVVIDPMAKFLRFGDANDYARVTDSLTPYISLARETHTHIMLVHHTTKADKGDEQSVLGSTAIFSGVDALLSMTVSGASREIRSRLRWGRQLDDMLLSYDQETGLLSVAGSKTEIKREGMQRRIVEFLQGMPNQTALEIKKAMAVDERIVRHALEQAVASGLLTRTGEGKRGDPHRFVVA